MDTCRNYLDRLDAFAYEVEYLNARIAYEAELEKRWRRALYGRR